MKKVFYFLLMLGTLLFVTGLLAQPTDKPKPKGMEGLELTDEQTAKMQDLRLKLEKEIVSLKSKLQSLEADLKQELVAEEFNSVKVKNLLEQKGKIRTEMELDHFMNQRAIRDVLTPHQRIKFDLQVLSEDAGPHPGPPMRPHEPGMNPHFRPMGDLAF
jgi:Spy/CpxP family protein refolding chaperone